MVPRTLIALALATLSPLVSACPAYETPDLRESLKSARRVVIFQLLSSAVVPGTENIARAVARVRVVESLSGTGLALSGLHYPAQGCGALRLDIGGFFLLATTQEGPSVALRENDRALVDITRFYSEGDPTGTSNAGIVNVVREYLLSGEAPAWFPPASLVYYTHAGGEPPPAPQPPDAHP